MKILYVTSEAAPYAASGGLGDVMASLPASVLASLEEGSEVAVILPLYAQVSAVYREKMEWVTAFEIPYVWRRSYVGI